MNKLFLGVFAALVLAACAIAPQSSHAQSGTNIRVIVMGEDSDPGSVVRSSNIFTRVLAETKGQVQRYGFRMVDEEMIAVDLGFQIRERRPKTELIETAKLANAGGKANLQSRALVLFRIFASVENRGFANKVRTRIEAEMYDLQTNQFLGTHELPRAEYPAPADCNDLCIREVVGDKAREISTSLADIMGAKLAYLSPGPAASAGASGATSGGSAGGGGVVRSSGVGGLMTTYHIEMKNFAYPEMQSILTTMTTEFPGYSSHDVISSTPALAKYEYVSNANAGKLVEWLQVVLYDMGLNPGQHAAVIASGTTIMLDKITTGPGPNVPASTRFR